jgi:hypothetical protein
MTPAEAKRFRRAWRRGGLPGFRTTPPQPPVPQPRKPVITIEAVLNGQEQARLERLASSREIASLSHAAQLAALLVLLTEAEILAAATRDDMDAVGRDLERSRAELAGGAR